MTRDGRKAQHPRKEGQGSGTTATQMHSDWHHGREEIDKLDKLASSVPSLIENQNPTLRSFDKIGKAASSHRSLDHLRTLTAMSIKCSDIHVFWTRKQSALTHSFSQLGITKVDDRRQSEEDQRSGRVMMERGSLRS